MRRHASEWATGVSLEIDAIFGAESLLELEGSSADRVRTGEGSTQRTGLRIVARKQEDVPGTWEALTTPRADGGRSQCKGQPEPRPMVARESEDRIRARKSGNGTASGPGGAKAVRAGVNFWRAPCLML